MISRAVEQAERADSPAVPELAIARGQRQHVCHGVACKARIHTDRLVHECVGVDDSSLRTCSRRAGTCAPERGDDIVPHIGESGVSSRQSGPRDQPIFSARLRKVTRCQPEIQDTLVSLLSDKAGLANRNLSQNTV